MDSESERSMVPEFNGNGRGIMVTGLTRSVSIFSVFPEDTLPVLYGYVLAALKEKE